MKINDNAIGDVRREKEESWKKHQVLWYAQKTSEKCSHLRMPRCILLLENIMYGFSIERDGGDERRRMNSFKCKNRKITFLV